MSVRNETTSRKKLTPTAAAKPATNSGAHAGSVSPERRHALIANAAYILAEQRGFEPGHELEDWIAAEREIDRHLLHAPPDPSH